MSHLLQFVQVKVIYRFYKSRNDCCISCQYRKWIFNIYFYFAFFSWSRKIQSHNERVSFKTSDPSFNCPYKLRRLHVVNVIIKNPIYVTLWYV